jgi:HAE1 family hydrophobic/amphiphilic exporter-1
VKRESGANVLDVMAGVQRAVAELNAGVLAVRGLQLMQTYDETVYIQSALSLVRHDVLIGSLLTIASLLLFLRSVRSTLVISLAIPISCIGTFVFIKLLGRSINVVSLAAITFAVGVVVDNATVVLENIYSHYQRGVKPFAAALAGTNEVWGAIVASTLASTAVFLPVVFIQEEAGQLFRDIAIAITVGVIISLFVSITVVPSAAARLLRQEGYAAPAPVDGRDAPARRENRQPMGPSADSAVRSGRRGILARRKWRAGVR